jgi:hypothetical protein
MAVGTRTVADTATSPGIAVARGGGVAESSNSAVSWAAISGGALAALAATAILLSLGTGIGLTTVSPWPNAGSTATTFGVVAAIWLVIVQWFSSALGGYLTGRLRTKWTGLHTDEVFFRDTAHGFLAWALATIVIVLLAGSAGTAALRGATSAVTSVATGAAQSAAGQAAAGNNASNPMGYTIDTLFRADNAAAGSNQDSRAEATRIIANGLRNGDLPPADRTYLAQLIASKTGVAQPEAEQRVDTAVTQLKDADVRARQAADTARKTTASISIITALSLLIGAFVASVAAAFGGRLRDEY